MRPFILILFISIVNSSHAQIYNDTCYKKDIKTIQIFNIGDELSHPVIFLKSRDKLKISFDDLSKNKVNYSYTIIHCNSKWEQSNISFYDYADGFENNPITDFKFSTNTIINYIHYTLLLPNSNCDIRLSGNYILQVKDDNDSLIFTRKFYVVERLAQTDFNIIRPEIPKYMKKFQQFNLKIKPNVSDAIDLRDEIKPIVFQNFNPLTSKDNIRATFLEDSILTYDLPDYSLFQGINEFRIIDIKSIKYQSQMIMQMKYEGPWHSISLYPDEPRYKQLYFFNQDLNGNFYIANTLGINKNIDADYVMVHFTLTTLEPIIDGDVFVYGAFSDWQCLPGFKMKYNFDKKGYEANVLLKQGFYNYLYAFRTGEGIVDLSHFEGSHFETENEYCVLVYYMQPTSRYERLIGYQVANSLHKNSRQ